MAEPSRQVHWSRRVVGGALLTAALCAGLVACGTSDGPGSEPNREGCGTGAACAVAPTTQAVAALDIQLRPVRSTDPASIADNPCPTDLPTPVPTEIIVAPGCVGGAIDTLYGLGPAALDGSAFETAKAVENGNTGEWVVNPVLKSGAAGLGPFNAAAGHCYAKDETCPTGQLAIVVDGVVISAPTIQAPSFQADQIQVSGGFTEASATALATGIDAAG
jgi:hypothetical protein